MKENNMKNKVWIYAVILFTSAFIVLLLTAFSQIKLNRNLDDFKSQISTKESEKNKYQLSYTNALEKVDELTAENVRLTEEKAEVQAMLDAEQKKQVAREEQYLKEKAEYEKLSAAQTEFLKENYIKSADTIKSIDKSLLDVEGALLFDTLSADVYYEAGQVTFLKGFEEYKNGKYSEAVNDLTISREYSSSGDYSAKNLYFLGYANFRLGENSKAIDCMKLLILEYPESTYSKKAKAFIVNNGG